MASVNQPPEINITLLKTKNLPKKSSPWNDNEFPIDVLLLTVKECEFLSCLSYLNPGFYKCYHDTLGYVYFGSIGEDAGMKLKIALMKCSEGSTVPGGSVVAVKNAVAALRPKAVFCVGYCASLNGEIAKLGDVVISAKLITYAPIKVTEDGIQERGHRVPPQKHLANLIKSAGDGWDAPLQNIEDLNVTVHRDGVFLSGPEMVQNQDRCAQLIERFPEAIAIEMEGAGLYTAAHDLEIEWIIIKGISEYADGNNCETESWRQFASVVAASLTAEILSDSIVFQTWRHYEDENAEHRPHEQAGRAFPPSGPKIHVHNVTVKAGTPSEDELEQLSVMLGDNWKKLARRLRFNRANVTAYDAEHKQLTEKAYEMLMDWKQREGSDGTYQVLYDALCHDLVACYDLALRVCCDQL